MKVLTIGDIHGFPDWKKVNPSEFDVIIFLGDYVDSNIVDEKAILENLEEIVYLKERFQQKVKLLLGNHENSYLFRRYRTSGYMYEMAEQVTAVLNNNLRLFQVAWQYQNYLWTHAGIHTEYYNQKIAPGVRETDESLALTLERLFKEEYPPLFEVGPERGGWDYNSNGGPFWLDSSRLLKNPLQGYHQIVGHTPVKTVELYRPVENDLSTSVTLCDCITRGDGSFYTLEIL